MAKAALAFLFCFPLPFPPKTGFYLCQKKPGGWIGLWGWARVRFGDFWGGEKPGRSSESMGGVFGFL